MKNKLLLTFFIISVGALTSYFLSGSLLIYTLTILVGVIALYIIKTNTEGRKENLNIIKDEKKLHFYLSDDLLFTVELPHNSTIKETLKNVVQYEKATIKNITRKICFINFRDDVLLKELNQSLRL